MLRKIFNLKTFFNRRFFLKAISLFGAVVAVKLLLPNQSSNRDGGRDVFRLPGAEDIDTFLKKCIKCGQCVQVCPYKSVVLLGIENGLSSGTPTIFPNSRACYLCDLLPCILSCPSGALNHDISLPEDVLIGEVTVISAGDCYGTLDKLLSEEDILTLIAHGTETVEEKELADKLYGYIGKKCSMCYDLCPYPAKDEAISLIYDDDGKYYPKINERCVGCGVCVELCPSSRKIFTITPI